MREKEVGEWDGRGGSVSVLNRLVQGREEGYGRLRTTSSHPNAAIVRDAPGRVRVVEFDALRCGLVGRKPSRGRHVAHHLALYIGKRDEVARGDVALAFLAEVLEDVLERRERLVKRRRRPLLLARHGRLLGARHGDRGRAEWVPAGDGRAPRRVTYRVVAVAVARGREGLLARVLAVDEESGLELRLIPLGAVGKVPGVRG